MKYLKELAIILQVSRENREDLQEVLDALDAMVLAHKLVVKCVDRDVLVDVFHMQNIKKNIKEW